MPTHLHTIYKQANKIEILLLICLAPFWIAIYFGCLFACIIHNPVVHEDITALVVLMIIAVGGGLGQLAFVLFGLFYCLRYRLIFDEHGITCRGMFSEQSITPCDITQLKWEFLKNRRKYRINLQTPTTKITMMLELLKKQPTHRNALICFLRETIPHEYQSGWEAFRQHIEYSFEIWHLDGKNHVPVVAEDEFLVTRKDLLQGSRGIILVSIVMAIIVYVCGYYKLINRGALFNVAVFLPLAVVLLFEMPMLIWGFIVLMWPKHGRKWKQSQRKQLTKAGRYCLAMIVLLQLATLPFFFNDWIPSLIRSLFYIACYVLLFFCMGAVNKVLQIPISDIPPEDDIPEVLRSVKSDPHSR